MKYRIRIEKWDDQHNLLTQSQAEIDEQQIKIMEELHDIDMLEETFKQLKEQFKQYEQNQSR